MRVLARRHGINQEMVAKWKKRESTAGSPDWTNRSEIDGPCGGARGHHRGVS